MTGSTKMTDSAPPYEELDSSSSQRPPSNPSTGYSSLPQNDLDQNTTPHQHGYLDAESQGDIPLVRSSQPHVHCEACDRLLERQQNRRYQHYCCALVSLTFIVAIICLLILGIAIARAKSDSH